MTHEVEFRQGMEDHWLVHAACDLEGTDFCGSITLITGRWDFYWGWQMLSRYTPEQRVHIEAAAAAKVLQLNIIRRLTT